MNKRGVHLVRRTRMTGRRRSQLGQSVTEFALLLPVMLGLAAVVLDVSRLYQAWITLEAATRDAAEYVATTQTTTAGAAAEAERVVCLATRDIVGYDRGSGTDDTTCDAPAVSLDGFSVSTTLPGATARFPIATARVSASFVFQPLIPYPFLTSGGVYTLRVQESFQIVQNR